MGPSLGDSAVLEHDDLVRVPHGRDPVRHDEACAATPPALEVAQDRLFRSMVDAREGVVQDQDRRTQDHRPREGDALALAARQGDAAFADDGVEAVLELLDLPFDLGPGGRPPHLLGGGIGDAVADVLGHRDGEQEAVLRHHRDARTQEVNRHPVQVHAVDQDRVVVHFQQPRHQADESRLAGPDRSHDADRAAGFDRKVDALERRHIAARIGEREVPELDPAADVRNVRDVLPIANRRHDVQDGAQPFQRREAALGDRHDETQHHRREREHANETPEQPQVLGAELTRLYPLPTQPQHHGSRQGRHQANAGEHRRLHDPDLHHPPKELLVLVLEALALQVGQVVGLDYQRARRVLLYDRRDLAELLLAGQIGLEHVAAVVARDQNEEREGPQRPKSQRGVHRQQHDQGAREQHRGLQQVQQTHSQEHPDAVDVVHRPRHEIAGAVSEVEGLRQALEMGEVVVADAELDLPADVEHHEAREQPRQSQTDRGGDQPEDRAPDLVRGVLERGDDGPDGQRDELKEGRVQEGENPAQYVRAGRQPHVSEQAGEWLLASCRPTVHGGGP